jgi:hypothetical protein
MSQLERIQPPLIDRVPSRADAASVDAAQGDASRSGDGAPIDPRSATMRRKVWTNLVLVTLLLAPVVASIAFVRAFSTPFPLTDEWSFVNSALAMQGVDLFTSAGWARAIEAFPALFNDHCVIVPFLYYWPLTSWTHFDSQWLIGTTMVAYAIHAVLFARFVMRSWWGVLPIVLVLFCPSHFMEFVWGWMFTFSLSIVFPLCGLVLVDRMRVARSRRARALRGFAALAAFVLGALSSAGGMFGLPCALVLLAVQPWPHARKLPWMVLIAAAAGVLYFFLVVNVAHQPATITSRMLLQSSTALGVVIVGSPVGLSDFELDARSSIGLVILACTIAVVVRALVVGTLSRIALAATIALFGFLCVAAVALGRNYLGNWHAQCALPAVCGAYAASFIQWRHDKSPYAAVPFFALLAVLLTCPIAYVQGFRQRGPDYRAYIGQIENYARIHLRDPNAPKPFPDGSPDLSANVLLFLSAHEHPVFHDAPPKSVAPLPESARIFAQEQELTRDSPIACGGSVVRLTVALPEHDAPAGVLARIAGKPLVLRRVDPSFGCHACGEMTSTVCYCAFVLPSAFASGEQRVEWSVFR